MQRLTATSDASPPLDCGSEASSSLDRSVWDSIRALQCEGDPNIVSELISIYLEDSTARLFEINRTVAIGDPAQIRRAAHALRGSSANLGANALAALCALLEYSTGTAGAAELAARIEVEFENVRAALELEGGFCD